MFHRLPVSQSQPQPQREPNFVQREALSPFHAAVHRSVEKSYEDLVQFMELSHDEGAALIETLTDYQVKIIELNADRRANSETPANRALRVNHKLVLDAQIKGLLGPLRFNYFENYRIGLLLKG